MIVVPRARFFKASSNVQLSYIIRIYLNKYIYIYKFNVYYIYIYVCLFNVVSFKC